MPCTYERLYWTLRVYSCYQVILMKLRFLGFCKQTAYDLYRIVGWMHQQKVTFRFTGIIWIFIHIIWKMHEIQSEGL